MSSGMHGVTEARIDRLLAALSCASVEQFDAPEAKIGAVTEDAFGMLEHAFAVFIAELADAKRNRDLVAEQQRVLDQQRLTIRELSTPIIDLWDGVLTLPVVGVIDTQRAVEMTEKLLERIVATGARAVIIDLTGVDVVDTMTADHLGRLARSARLLGARCIITGIGAGVARTLVSIGVDFTDVDTLRTLKDGLRACIAGAG